MMKQTSGEAHIFIFINPLTSFLFLYISLIPDGPSPQAGFKLHPLTDIDTDFAHVAISSTTKQQGYFEKSRTMLNGGILNGPLED